MKVILEASIFSEIMHHLYYGNWNRSSLFFCSNPCENLVRNKHRNRKVKISAQLVPKGIPIVYLNTCLSNLTKMVSNIQTPVSTRINVAFLQIKPFLYLMLGRAYLSKKSKVCITTDKVLKEKEMFENPYQMCANWSGGFITVTLEFILPSTPVSKLIRSLENR